MKNLQTDAQAQLPQILPKKDCATPHFFGKNKIVLEKHQPTNTMNPSDSSTNFITRRDFMKKSALTVGAVTLLSQGIGLAVDGSGSSDSSHVHEKLMTEGVVSDGQGSYRWYFYSCACGWTSKTYIEPLP